ncbi:MAG: FtsH protease activity modulator HflK [Gammaproteobacteria bacterium]
MAWNEPGSGGKDPWGGGGEKGPPDLEEVVRNLQNKLGGLFGGRKGGGSGQGGGNGSGPGSGGGGPISAVTKGGFGLLIVIALIAWGLSGIYIVDEGRRGVVLRFGQYVETTSPGPHWHIPFPVESVEIVDVERRRFVEIGYRSGGGGRAAAPVPREALMLTEDENIVDVRIAVQYQISDPKAYLFNVRDPDETLKQGAESAIREVIGKSKMDFVLTEGRSEVVARIQELLQAILDQYTTGLQVTNVNLQDAQPPEEVQAAFADAIKAREDEQRLKNEAEAYANEVIPKARGAAARQLEEANAYKEQVIAEAQGDASRFEQLLVEYEKAPEVTRERLYLEAIESVLARSNKVILDTEGTNNLTYLPLDRIIDRRVEQRGENNATTQADIDSGTAPITSAADDFRIRDNQRSRRTR